MARAQGGDIDRAAAGRRLRSRMIGAVAALLVGTGFTEVIARSQYSTGPEPGATGAVTVGGIPAERDCTDCHDTKSGVNLNTPGGAVEILDLPESYEAGTTYDLRIRLHSDSTLTFPDRRWGFQITAVKQSDGSACGSFIPPPGDSLLTIQGFGPYASRFYTEHSHLATRTGLGGPVEWRLSWQAPAGPEGKALFFAAGNAANGNLDSTGDFIFTTSDSVEDITTPTLPVSWSAVKSLYR